MVRISKTEHGAHVEVTLSSLLNMNEYFPLNLQNAQWKKKWSQVQSLKSVIKHT